MIHTIINGFTNLMPLGFGALFDIVFACFIVFMVVNIILSITYVINQIKELFRIV